MHDGPSHCSPSYQLTLLTGEGGISGTGKLESVNLNFDTFFKVMKSALGEEYMDENGDEDEDGDSDLEGNVLN